MRELILLIYICIAIPEGINSQSGWIQQNSGEGGTLRSVHFLNENTGFAVGINELKTTNGGNNWFQAPAYYDSYDIQFIDSSLVYLVGFFKPVTFQKSTNGGLNWSLVSNPPVGTYPYLPMKFFNAGTGFINTYKTTNAGISWINTYPAQTMVSIYFLNENTGWGCHNSGTVIKTTNGGANWSAYSAGSGTGLQSIFFINENTGWAVGSSSRVYKSTNGGINWSMIFNQGLCGLNTLYFVNDQTGWIAGCEGAIHRTTNGGTSWVQQSFGTTTYLYDMHFVSEQTGWAVGANGKILKTTTGGLTPVTPISSQVPDGYFLLQNYPNPFNPETNIEFRLPAAGNTRLTIYDMLGRKIAVLVNEKLEPGSYKVGWNASQYASGVYYYELRTMDFSSVKKMIIIR